jgi:hypothetical protein
LLEAEPIPANYYVDAALFAIKTPIDVAIIASDSRTAVNELIEYWRNYSVSYNIQLPKRYVTRVVDSRPDRGSLADANPLISMLVDIKLFTIADHFVGTQSSNFGLLVCYLRGGHSCINAETMTSPFNWRHADDKLT